MKKERLRKTTSFSVSGTVIIFILVLIALITLYPFVYTLAGSFNDGTDFEKGGVWLFPRVFTLDNYAAVFSDYRLWIGLGNTVLRTVVGTAAALIVTSCVAYAMSQRELPCKRFFRVFNVITMFFSGGIVPFFLVVNILGLYDNFLVYILPSLYSVYNMIVISSGYRGISEELHDSAVIDGAGELRIWAQIYFPLSICQSIQVKLISECSEICHIRPCIQRCDPVDLMVWYRGYMCTHTAHRVTVGRAILDLDPLHRVGIVACPALRRIIKHSRIETSATARAGLKQDMRKL